MKSNRAGLEDSPGGGNVRAADKRGEECANPNKVPEDKNSFLADETLFVKVFFEQEMFERINKNPMSKFFLLMGQSFCNLDVFRV